MPVIPPDIYQRRGFPQSDSLVGVAVAFAALGFADLITIGAKPGVFYRSPACLAAEPAPQPEDSQAVQRELSNRLLVLNVGVSQRAPSVALFSQRGDVLFFLGRFSKAVADYREMVHLDPQLADNHWRLGLALYYDGQAKEAAEQFERCHTIDSVDRENGIWRYFSQVKSEGREKARAQLIQYKRPDREPFGDVYQLFSGELTGEAILKKIHEADISEEERQKRMFYAELYVGLNEAIGGDPARARGHLQAAIENSWPRTAGYGPNYMWHLARVQLALLPEPAEKEAGSKQESGVSGKQGSFPRAK